MTIDDKRKRRPGDPERVEQQPQSPQGEQTAPQDGQEPQPGGADMRLMQRQSAPQQTARDYMQQLRAAPGGTGAPQGAASGFDVLAEKVGLEQLHKAQTMLQKYKAGKASLEARIVEDEQWYKLRHWEQLRGGGKHDVQPVSGWLFNCLSNKHADAMDNFPAPNILPREEGDKGEAKMLSSIVPVVLDQCEFEQTYSDVWDYKLKTGTGVYGVFWDKTKFGGLGDISIKKVDLLNLYWEPGITDIQKSRQVFHVELADNELLADTYPQLAGKLGGTTMDVTKYMYDDTVDTSGKSLVVDWYYKKQSGGKVVLHYCKYCGDVVLFATENAPEYAERGWYDHGLYPFILDPLYKVEGTPCGFGYIDVGKSAQEYIDRGNQAIMRNMLANAKPRHFIRSDGSVNEEEYADTDKDFVHVDGGLGQDSILPVPVNPLSQIYTQIVDAKVNELKEVTGNRDVSTGGTSSGVTAASAIAAMQEAGSKLSRDNTKASYRAYRRTVLMVIELIRQFYDLPRKFRILGENGAAEYVQYSNAGIQPQPQGIELGMDMGFRLPLFDIEITAQKASPYSKMSQNELALQFFSQGFFNPQMADQALACIDMMDFDRKDAVAQKIAQNGGMYQQMLGLAQAVDNDRGTNLVGAMTGQPQGDGKGVDISRTEALGGSDSEKKESKVTEKARQRVAESTTPR